MQSRGQWGPRDIHNKVWELPIPRYDPSDAAHEELAWLGQQCTKKVAPLTAQGFKLKSIGHIRKTIKNALKDELARIDVIVARFLAKAIASQDPG